MRTTTRAAAVALTATIVIGTSATSAIAQSETIKDKSSDVLSFVDLKDEQGVVLGYADSIASGVDLRSLRVKHTKKSVSVTVKLSNLKDDTTIGVAFRLNGETKPSRLLFNTWDDRGQVVNPRGDRRCMVPLTTKSGTGGSVTAVIKRSCLGNPKKLKASVSSLSPGAFDDVPPILTDVLSPDSVRTEAWTSWLKAG